MNSVKRYWYFYFLLLLKIGPKWCFSLFIRVVESTAQILVFWLSKWRSIWSERSILLLFCDSSREPRLRKLLLYASLYKKRHSKSNCGRNHGKTTSTFENCNHQFRLSHQKILSIFHQDVSTSSLGHFVASKSIISFHMENVHHNFELFMSNIFENWMRKLVIKPSSITSNNLRYVKIWNGKNVIIHVCS